MNSINQTSICTDLALINTQNTNEIHDVALEDYFDIIQNRHEDPKAFQTFLPGLERVLEEAEDRYSIPIYESREEIEAACQRSAEIRKEHAKSVKAFEQHRENLIIEYQMICDRLINDHKKVVNSILEVLRAEETHSLEQRLLLNEERKKVLKMESALNKTQMQLKEAQMQLDETQIQLEKAQIQLGRSQWKIASLQQELDNAQRRIQTLEQTDVPLNANQSLYRSSTPDMVEAIHHTPPHQESWGAWAQKYAPGFFTGFLGIKQSPTTSSNHPRSPSLQEIPTLSETDDANSSDNEDVLRNSYGPAPPQKNWRARIAVWIQRGCRVCAHHIQNFFKKMYKFAFPS